MIPTISHVRCGGAEVAIMADVQFMITAADQKVSELDDLAKSLREKGLTVHKTIPRAGAIVGSGDSSLVDALKSVKGVQDVREERTFQLPPMDEKIPQ
jgi:phage-related protein